MSMEEEQARQAAAAQAAATSSAPAASSSAAASAPEAIPAEPTDEEEEALLKQALAMSEANDVEMAEHAEDDDEMSEEDAIARAIEMSMKPEGEGEDKK